MFLIKYFAILAIAVAVKANPNESDETSLINDVNNVVLMKKSKTVVIFVCDGNIMFVSTEPDSQQMFIELGVPLEKVEIFRDTFEALNPMDILLKLAKLRAMRSTFVVYFTEEDSWKPPPKPQPPKPLKPAPPLPEYTIKEIQDIILVVKSRTIVILVLDGVVKFVSTEPDSDNLLKNFNVPRGKLTVIRDSFEPNNPTDVIDRLNNYRKFRPTFLIYFTVYLARPLGPRPTGLLVPEYLIYDINDLLLVQKVKTIVIFVRHGKVVFATTEADSPSKLAELGYSPDKLKTIKEMYECLNPFDILGKLSKIRYDTDTFLMYFTEAPGTQIPETSTLINQISDVVMLRRSKTCVIYVSGGRVLFVTTEGEFPKKKNELGISNKIEIIKETFELKNPFDILGKLAQMRSNRDTFLVFFTAGQAAQSPGYLFPESLTNEINDILLVKKSKTVAILVIDGKIEFVCTESEGAGKLTGLSNIPVKLETIKDTYEPLDPFDILGKLAKILSRRSTFYVIFTEAPIAKFPEINTLVTEISTIILTQNSKSCVVYVTGGNLVFITSELHAAAKMKEFNVPKNVETIREIFEPRNPFDILGKLIKLQSSRDTFLVYFTEAISRPPIAVFPPSAVPLPPGPRPPPSPGFGFGGFQFHYKVFQRPGFSFPYLQLPNYQYNYQYPQRRTGGSLTIEATKSGGGIFGVVQKAMRLEISKGGVVPFHTQTFGLNPHKVVQTHFHFVG